MYNLIGQFERTMVQVPVSHSSCTQNICSYGNRHYLSYDILEGVTQMCEHFLTTV